MKQQKCFKMEFKKSSPNLLSGWATENFPLKFSVLGKKSLESVIFTEIGIALFVVLMSSSRKIRE